MRIGLRVHITSIKFNNYPNRSSPAGCCCVGILLLASGEQAYTTVLLTRVDRTKSLFRDLCIFLSFISTAQCFPVQPSTHAGEQRIGYRIQHARIVHICTGAVVLCVVDV